MIKLEPQDYDDALRQIHRDDNNRFNPDADGWVVRSWIELTDNPDSFMILMEQGADGLPDPRTEVRVPLHRGSRFVVDTQRLWHVVCHTGTEPRYALISSFESGPALEAWIASQHLSDRSAHYPSALTGDAWCTTMLQSASSRTNTFDARRLRARELVAHAAPTAGCSRRA